MSRELNPRVLLGGRFYEDEREGFKAAERELILDGVVTVELHHYSAIVVRVEWDAMRGAWQVAAHYTGRPVGVPVRLAPRRSLPADTRRFGLMAGHDTHMVERFLLALNLDRLAAPAAAVEADQAEEGKR